MGTTKASAAILAAAMAFGTASAVPTLVWDDIRDEGPNAMAWDVAVDEWGDTIVVSDGVGVHGCTTTKYDKWGNVIWSHPWGVAGDFCSHVAIGKYGTVFVGGHDGEDFRVIEYQSGGQLNWVTSPGTSEHDWFNDLAVDSTGRAIGVGEFGSGSFEAHDAGVLKWGPTGLKEWSWPWPTGDSRFFSVAVGPDDSIVATGEYNGAAFTVKLSSTGFMQWYRVQDPGTIGFSVAVDSAGNVVVTGQWNDPAVPVSTVRTWSYDPSGTPRWDDTVTSEPDYYGRDVVVDAAGNAYVVADSSVSNKPILAVRYDPGGSLDWTQTYNMPGSLDHAREARVDGAGNLHVGATGEYANGDLHAWIISWDPSGALRWAAPYTNDEASVAGIDVYSTEFVALGATAKSISGPYTDVLAARYGKWVFDPFEVDWTWQHASSWLRPGGNSGGRNFSGDPFDFMSFHAHAGESYDVRAQPQGPDLDGVIVSVLSPDGGTVLARAMPEGDETLLRFTADAPGTYHLEFEPQSGVAGDGTGYTVDVTGNARVSALFSRTLPDGMVDGGSDALQLKDGGIAVIGDTGPDALVARFGPLGEAQWAMGYGTAGTDRAMAALPVRNGALAVVGETAVPGSPSDAFGMEVDPVTGEVLHAWTLGGRDDDRLTAIAHDPVQPPSPGAPPDPDVVIQQGWIAAGLTRSFGMGGDDGLLLRADNNGDPMWAIALGSDQDEHVEAIAKTPDDGILAVGPTASGRAWVARFELDGQPSWMRSFVGTTPGDLVPRGVAALADGGFVVAGDGPSASGLPETDLWVARFDRLGNPRWSRMLAAAGDQMGEGVEELVDGNLVVVGSTQAPGGDRDGWIVRLDREGTVLSQRSYGGPLDDELRDVRRREGLGFVVAGTRGVTDGSGTQSTDAWLLALGMDGELADGCALVADTVASAVDFALTSSDPGFAVTPVDPTTMPWDATAQSVPVMHAPECVLNEPGEVTGLRFRSKTDLEWDTAPDVDGYQVMRGDVAGLPAGDYGTLLEAVEPETASDPASPAPGQVWQYLIRGTNALGTGPAGMSSAGPRAFPPEAM